MPAAPAARAAAAATAAAFAILVAILPSIELVLSPQALNHLGVVQQLPVVLVTAGVDLWEGKRFS
jgi:hypothetical protein